MADLISAEELEGVLRRRDDVLRFFDAQVSELGYSRVVVEEGWGGPGWMPLPRSAAEGAKRPATRKQATQRNTAIGQRQGPGACG